MHFMKILPECIGRRASSSPLFIGDRDAAYLRRARSPHAAKTSWARTLRGHGSRSHARRKPREAPPSHYASRSAGRLLELPKKSEQDKLVAFERYEFFRAVLSCN
jgi:hypothetical protein